MEEEMVEIKLLQVIKVEEEVQATVADRHM